MNENENTNAAEAASAQNSALQVKQMEYELSPIGQEMRQFEMVQRKAKMYAASSIVPDKYKNNVADCSIAIDMALRMGANPLMVMQNLYVVHGNPSFSSKFLIAALNATGRFSPINYVWNDEKGEKRGCHAEATRKSDGVVLKGPEVTLEMAKKEGWSTKNGSKWLTMPDLMLCYRAAAFFQRLYAPEVSMGFITTEEAEDMGTPQTVDATYEDVTEKVNAEVANDEAPVPEQPMEEQQVTDAMLVGKPLDDGSGQLNFGEAQAEQPKQRKPAFGSR